MKTGIVNDPESPAGMIQGKGPAGQAGTQEELGEEKSPSLPFRMFSSEVKK
jgi:hypothetical protein